MGEELDEDKQPISRAFNWNRLKDSRTDELIGICRGVLADGALVWEEARFVLDWLRRNPPVQHSSIGRELEPALVAALRDESLSAEAEEQMVTLLLRIIGGTPRNECDASYSSALPLDNPIPEIIFLGRLFCFTGKFSYGTRTICEQACLKMGAVVHPRIVEKTSFLIVGEVGSRDWAHSAMGRKIERAISLRDKGAVIGIVSERTWLEAMGPL
jgi:NAD-dependent DNA ligase